MNSIATVARMNVSIIALDAVQRWWMAVNSESVVSLLRKAADIIERYERDNTRLRIELASLTAADGDTGIEDLDLSIRSYNCLKRARVNTVGQLESLSRNDLLDIRNLGDKQIDEISEKMLEIGHKLKEVDDD